MPLWIQKIKFLWSGFEVINLFIFVPLTWRFLMHKKTLKWFWGRPGLLSWQLSADNFLLTPPILQSLLWTAIKTVDLLVLSHKISDCSKWIVYSSGCWNQPASNWNPEGKSTFGRLVDRSWANARRKICLIAGSPRWCIGKCHQFMFAANLEQLCIPHAVVLMVVSGIFGVRCIMKISEAFQEQSPITPSTISKNPTAHWCDPWSVVLQTTETKHWVSFVCESRLAGFL